MIVGSNNYNKYKDINVDDIKNINGLYTVLHVTVFDENNNIKYNRKFISKSPNKNFLTLFLFQSGMINTCSLCLTDNTTFTCPTGSSLYDTKTVILVGSGECQNSFNTCRFSSPIQYGSGNNMLFPLKYIEPNNSPNSFLETTPTNYTASGQNVSFYQEITFINYGSATIKVSEFGLVFTCGITNTPRTNYIGNTLIWYDCLPVSPQELPTVKQNHKIIVRFIFGINTPFVIPNISPSLSSD